MSRISCRQHYNHHVVVSYKEEARDEVQQITGNAKPTPSEYDMIIMTGDDECKSQHEVGFVDTLPWLLWWEMKK